jgi:hypothetical protein
MSGPRGRIVMPSRPVHIGGGVVITGPKPGLIVYVRAQSGRLMREFHRFCAHNGIHPRPVQEAVPGRPDAWECIGSIDALERLIGHPAVMRWHYILDVRAPVGGQGCGEVTDRVRHAINRDRLPKADRLAAEETERRARLSRKEQLDIELHEARQRAAAL